MSKTTTKRKEKIHEQEKAKGQTESPEVVLTVVPSGGSVVVPDRRDSLQVFRLNDPARIKVFETDIADLFQRYLAKSGEDAAKATNDFLDYVAYCGRPEVFFLVGVDSWYKCRAYCVAHSMATGVFFIRQLVVEPKYGEAMRRCWGFIENAAKSVGCHTIEATTRIDERIYGRWVRQFGMEKQCTVYRKEIKHGQSSS